MMERHFVTFLSPGTFVAEATTKPIDGWLVGEAVEMSKDIVERYDARPYGFYFTTRSRSEKELDSSEVSRSGMYYLNGQIYTLGELEERSDPDEEILRSNMLSNNWSRVVVSLGGRWRWTQPFNKGDVLIDQQKGVEIHG